MVEPLDRAGQCERSNLVVVAKINDRLNAS